MRRGNRGGIRLWWLNQVEDRLGQSAHEDVEDARFEGGQMSSPEDVNSGDGESDGDKDTQDGKEVDLGGGASLSGNFLTDRMESGATNVFCSQDFQPAFGDKTFFWREGNLV